MFRTDRFSSVLCMLVLCFSASFAAADEALEVARLDRSGAHDEALTRADQFLKSKPADANMRFLRGVILMDLKRDDEAIDVFSALTQEFPNLAEPYNNLGVLMSRQGRYGEARDALELAIRSNPAFALAHENLGDVYIALAAQSFARSKQLNPAGGATSKLALVRQWPSMAAP